MQWLADMKTQPIITKNAKPKLTSAQLAEQGSWASADAVVAAVEEIKAEAMDAWEKHKAKGWPLTWWEMAKATDIVTGTLPMEASHSLEAASTKVMDALMAVLTFGYVPCMR